MKRFDFPLIADTLFYTAASWFVFVGIFRWANTPSGICFSCATLLALAVGVICFCLISLRHRKVRLNKSQQSEKEKLMLHLTLESDEKVRKALLGALQSDNQDARCCGENLILGDTPLVPIFTMEPVSADTVAHLLKEYSDEPFILLCNALSADAERLLASFSRTAMTGNEVYDLFARTKTMPEHLICGNIPRKSVKSALKRSFSKRNAYPFFISGASLLLMSLFVLFPVYYLVVGTVLLAASVLIRAFGIT